MPDPEIRRAFIKHRVFAEIYAVEVAMADGTTDYLAALRCSRPEELTRGALPVLALTSGPDWSFVQTNAAEFDPWEPPMVNEEKLEAILAAERCCAECEGKYKLAHADASLAKKAYEKACDDLRRVVREAADAEPEKPLLAIAERPDADLGRSFDGHTDDGPDTRDDERDGPDAERDSDELHG